MKTSVYLAIATLITTASVQAQGPLTPPPGAPAPVMKSLDQVEARTPLVAGQTGVSINANGTITISQRGSYYLTGNLTITTAAAEGIVINHGEVTLDLNGFSLICTSVSGGDAISINSVSNIRIHNGTIIGGSTWNGSVFTLAGWQDGIGIATGVESNLSASDLTVSGTRACGIDLWVQGSRVDRCSVHTTGTVGVRASQIVSTTSRITGSTAITAPNAQASTVDNCYGEAVSVSPGDGIRCDGSVTNSRGISATGIGIQAYQVSNSYGNSVSGVGMVAVNVTNSMGMSFSGTHGMNVSGTASFCRGFNYGGGTSIQAAIAIGCTTGIGTISSPQKHLGTP